MDMQPKILALFLPIFAQAAMFQLNSNSDIIGKIQHAEIFENETLALISRDYEVGINELKKANPGISEKNIPVGTKIIIPTQYVLPEKSMRHGIVVNMAELRLYYFPKDQNVVYTYPVAMGRDGWRTPTTVTAVKGKAKDPIWHVPQSIREHAIDRYGNILPEKVMPGPENPLGKFAIYLKQKGILIHGTNNPASIGKHVSSGCIRMFNSNVKQLFNMVKIGEIVSLIHHAHKLGYDDRGRLYLESHPSIDLEEEKNEHNHVDIKEKLTLHEHSEENANSVINSAHGYPRIIN